MQVSNSYITQEPKATQTYRFLRLLLEVHEEDGARGEEGGPQKGELRRA